MKKTLCLGAAVWAVMSLQIPANAHDQSSHPTDRVAPTDPQLTVETITDNLHVLFGPGGNIGVSSGPDGVVLVDNKFSRNAEEILYHLSQIAGENDDLIFVINTHLHGDHSGSNPEMVEAGAMIMAHENVRTRMGTSFMYETFGHLSEAQDESFWPIVTFSDQASLHFNGMTARAIHTPSAHTDGDSIVVFEEPNVLHMGDNLFVGQFPFIDVDAGGSIVGMIAAHDVALNLVDVDTVIIPGHGPITNQAGLQGARDVLQTIHDRIRILKDAGNSLQEIIDEAPLADMANMEGFVDQEGIITAVWRSFGGEID